MARTRAYRCNMQEDKAPPVAVPRYGNGFFETDSSSWRGRVQRALRKRAAARRAPKRLRRLHVPRCAAAACFAAFKSLRIPPPPILPRTVHAVKQARGASIPRDAEKRERERTYEGQDGDRFHFPLHTSRHNEQTPPRHHASRRLPSDEYRQRQQTPHRRVFPCAVRVRQQQVAGGYARLFFGER
jgi:hypothetical protein